MRQPSQADQGAEQRGGDDAEQRHAEGIQHPDRKRPQIAVRRVVGDQRRLADREAGFAL